MSGDDFFTLHEMAKRARDNLSDDHWDYLIGGADTESALKRNRYGLDSWVFRPRVLNDVSEVDISTELHGVPLRMPVMLPPKLAMPISWSTPPPYRTITKSWSPRASAG